MHGAEITANPLKLDIRSHWKCLMICAFVTVATFQYGTAHELIRCLLKC